MTVSKWCRERLIKNKLPEEEKAEVNFADEKPLTGPKAAWAPDSVPAEDTGHTRD